MEGLIFGTQQELHTNLQVVVTICTKPAQAQARPISSTERGIQQTILPLAMECLEIASCWVRKRQFALRVYVDPGQPVSGGPHSQECLGSNIWSESWRVKELKGTKMDGQEEGVDLNEFRKDEYDSKALYETWNSQRANKKLK